MYKDFRRLTKKEKKLAKYILSNKDKDLSGLQVGRILLQYINFQGIYFNSRENVVEIFKEDLANAHKSYKQICDLCLFIEEMQEAGLVNVDTIMNNQGTVEEEKTEFWIYDHQKYEVFNDLLLKKDNDVSIALPSGTPVERFHSKTLVRLLQEYVYNKVVIPRASLTNLKRSCFFSREELQLRVLIWTLIISVFSLVASVLMPLFVSTKIESNDLENISKSANEIVLHQDCDTTMINTLQNISNTISTIPPAIYMEKNQDTIHKTNNLQQNK